MSNSSFYGGSGNNGPSHQPPAYTAPNPPAPVASGAAPPHQQPSSEQGDVFANSNDKGKPGSAQPGDLQQYQYGQYAPPPGPPGQTQGPSMQHSASYGPPAHYAGGPVGGPPPSLSPPGQQYPGPNGPYYGGQPNVFVMGGAGGGYPQNNQYGYQQQQQQQGQRTSQEMGCCGTCLAVMCGICAADALCDICF